MAKADLKTKATQVSAADNIAALSEPRRTEAHRGGSGGCAVRSWPTPIWRCVRR